MSRTRQPIFRNATATSHIHTLSLHDALPISYSEALEMTVAVYRALSEVRTAAGFEGVLVGDEGGFGPRLHSNEQAIEMVLKAIERAGLKPGTDAVLALDVASTHFYRDGRYHLREGGGRILTADEM